MEGEGTSIVYFFDKCRLCLDNAGIKNILEEHAQEDVYLCTGVTVTETDELPQKLCEMCYEIVTKAKRLRVLATKNNQFLKMLFDSDDNEGETLVIAVKTEIESDKEEVTLSPSQCSQEPSVPGLSLSVRSDLFTNSTSPTPNNDLSEAEERQKARQVFLDNGNTEFECLTCNRRYPTHRKLYHHQRQHIKNIICESCPKTFASKADLKKHERTHTGERPYRCNICTKCFAQRITLRQHKENIHNMLDS